MCRKGCSDIPTRARVLTEVEFSLATVTNARAYAQMQELASARALTTSLR
ncbi:MAG: hypothetical protein AAF494_06625 [Pseudomonadota bacterium]